MARRKKKLEDHINHERWLVSYADFITLLFAFFVVMYSISSVNEGKYRVLSDTLESAFKQTSKSDKPVQVGEISRTLNPLNSGVQNPASNKGEQSVIKPVRPAAEKTGSAVDGENDKVLDALNDELGNSLASLVDQNLVTLRRHKDGLEVELKSKVLFEKGTARLSIEAEKLLIRVASTLIRFPTSIQVEGHTDSTPISSPIYPSNWELSASRAAAVVSLFAEHDMDPTRIWAVGYAQYRPYTSISNDVEQDSNRRVVLMIRPNFIPTLLPRRTDAILERRQGTGAGQ